MAETAEERIRRLIAMVPWLMANSGITVAQAATHFGISAERMIDDLRLLIVIGRDNYIDIQFWFDEEIADDDDDIPSNPAAIIKVIDPQGFDKPLKFPASDVANITAQLQLLNAVYGHISPAFNSVFEKFLIRNGINDAGQEAIRVEERRRSPLDVMREAIQAGGCVDVRYASDSRDEVTDRTLQPVRITTIADLTYVECWTCGSADTTLKRYRIDRILACRPSATEAVDLSHVDTSARPPQPTAGIEAVVSIHPGSRWLLEEYNFHAIEPQADGSTKALMFMGDSADYAVRWGLQHAGFATIIEPRTVAEEVRRRAAAALDLYAEGVTPTHR